MTGDMSRAEVTRIIDTALKSVSKRAVVRALEAYESLPAGVGRRVRMLVALSAAKKELAAEIMHDNNLSMLRKKLALARQALIDSGYFTADQVGDDIAPRITELVSAWRPEKVKET